MMRIAGWLLLLTALLLGSSAAAQSTPDFRGDPSLPAPEFVTGLDWLNVPAPLTLSDLRGKVLLLDFWTYGCINCIHMIPTLQQLEAKYGDALAIIGVHSAKFIGEGKTGNLRQIVQRYGLTHPVINDVDFKVWQQYSVRAWPTFVLIDPLGNLFAQQAGEIPFDAFDKVIGGMIAQFDGENAIDRTPLPIRLEGADVPASALAYPGKVLADAQGGRLFIADSSHNRLIIADLRTDEVLDVIGSGAVGLTDGDYASATFRKPQGMVLHNDTLYVADTQNHAIRAVDLLRRTVTTAAGTGEQSYDRAASGSARETALASPWDIAAGDGDELYIAMAGLHQIWRFNLATDTVSWLVGSGREGLLDAPFESAELAQPSGLVYRDGVLYFADSESSTIRAADLTSRTVTTLAGTVRNDLFDFGDKDGGAGDSRLQHPLGVALGADGLLYIADTYNNKIKQIDPAQRQISTLFGQGGEGGFRDGDAAAAAFDEPGGLAYANGTLFVADTNNGVLRAIDLTAGTVRTISFPNPAALQIADQVTVVGGNSAAGEALELPPQTVAPGAGQAELTLELPEGYKLNTLAPFSAEWSSDGAAVQIADADRAQSMIAPTNPITLPLTFATGSATLRGDLTIYYCEAVNESLCFIDRVTLVVPVQVATEAANGVLILKRTITPPVPEPLK